jgi:predicted RND superfamily exporter protein
MVKTPASSCARYDILAKVDALDWQLRALPGVDSTNSLALLNRRMLVGLNEGNAKWYELQNNQAMLNMITASAPRGLYNEDCSLLTLYAYLTDHKAETLTRVVEHVERRLPRPTTPTRFSSCWRRAMPVSRPPPISWSSKPTTRCCSGVWRDPAVPDHLSLLAPRCAR